MIKFKVLIKVTANIPKSEWHPDDIAVDPPGVYEYLIEANTADEAQDLALDEFHLMWPIKVLDDFDIQAYAQ